MTDKHRSGRSGRSGEDTAPGNRLGGYLRARRELVTPEQAGLPPGGNRRVPGLRREEVALLAGISPDYYLRLERGRDKNPSPQVLSALARVLRLDDVERTYLIGLAAARPRAPRRKRPEHVPARVHELLAHLQIPAFVEGRAFDVLASNPMAVALSPRLRPGENRLRSLLLDPEERSFHQDWAQATAEFVAALRTSIGDDTDNPRFVELVGELALSSQRFRTLWARHDVRLLDGGTATVHHPAVGELRLHRDKLPIADVILVVYYPDKNSDSDEKLRLLASLSHPGPQPEGPHQPNGGLTEGSPANGSPADGSPADGVPANSGGQAQAPVTPEGPASGPPTPSSPG
ncbi:helix-turn-helix transcriptional regulator [Streptomyces varsoviensis]|uniref:helix-turn-helix transcriptional regulator n=1 Tax=Streptomyces varsoviensis TaxID=67373 RepID=UPI0009979FF3|nr:helix-turn-helix transcriptional regulator [Streptomyces varsoviensis]